MELKVTSEADKTHVHIAGRVDETGALELEKCFQSLPVKPKLHVIIDFRDIDYIGSAGVGTLLLLYKKVAMEDGKITVENIPKDIYSLLADGMNLGRVFNLKSI